MDQSPSDYPEMDFIDQRILGISLSIRRIKDIIYRAAQVEYPVLLFGETGVGKTLFAECIHQMSRRKTQTFLHQNCSNIPESLFESDFFGHEKGAFTGADAQKIGKLAIANRGSLFLDEIGELSLQNQAKLLLFLENGIFFPIGGIKENRADVRIIAATNKDLFQEIKRKKFRVDLFYRIGVLLLHIPPLRDRKIDIPIFVERILSEENRCRAEKLELTQEAFAKLMDYTYPGNIRELENILKRAVALTKTSRIRPEDIQFLSACREFNPTGRSKWSKEKIIEKLNIHDGNKSKTANELGISRTHLYRLLDS